MRERIDISEIEAKTKIRAKYLRALENEEWGVRRGRRFEKRFVPTAPRRRGRDGRALVGEQRLHHEHPGEGMLEPIVSGSSRNRGRGLRGTGGRPGRSGGDPGPSRGYTIAVATIVAVVLLPLLFLAPPRSPEKNSSQTPTQTKNPTNGPPAPENTP